MKDRKSLPFVNMMELQINAQRAELEYQLIRVGNVSEHLQPHHLQVWFLNQTLLIQLLKDLTLDLNVV